jgi:hypothetical protein
VALAELDQHIRGSSSPFATSTPAAQHRFSPWWTVCARSWSTERTHGWYDLAVTSGAKADLQQRYAGHLENGRDSISDPAMGGLV